MTELTLVRHSLPEIDASVPSAMWRLSEEGRARCLVLASRLAAETHIDRVVSSPEPKAHKTAVILAEELGKPFTVHDGLREHVRSGTGLLAKEEFAALMAEFFAQPGKPVFGDETADEAHSRFAGAISSLTAAYPDENIAAVTHGIVMSLFLSRTLGRDAFALWKSMGLPGFATLSLPGYSVLRWEL